MMNKFVTPAILLAVMVMCGCSWMPYEEEFACSRNPTYGKCVSVEGAYEEAVTGVPQGKVITKDGVSDKDTDNGKANKSTATISTPASEEIAYGNYRTELYSQLRQLVAAPETPMVKKPVESRTLILSYSPNQKKDRLYMPRYVYSIHETAEFVMGQYRLDTDPSIRQIHDFLNHDAK